MHTPIAERLDDARALEASEKSAPWRSSFAVAPSPEPALDMAVDMGLCPTAEGAEWRARIASPKKLGDLRLTMLDHHGDPLGPTAKIDHQGGEAVVAFTLPASFRDAAWGVEGVHLQVSDLGHSGTGLGAWDYATSPSAFYAPSDGLENRAPPASPRCCQLHGGTRAGAETLGLGAAAARRTLTPTTAGLALAMLRQELTARVVAQQLARVEPMRGD